MKKFENLDGYTRLITFIEHEDYDTDAIHLDLEAVEQVKTVDLKAIKLQSNLFVQLLNGEFADEKIKNLIQLVKWLIEMRKC